MAEGLGIAVDLLRLIHMSCWILFPKDTPLDLICGLIISFSGGSLAVRTEIGPGMNVFCLHANFTQIRT
jgi:hypothetical protein